MNRTPLTNALSDWTDIDVAAHALARALGLMPAHSAMSDAKWVYWTHNKLGDELFVLLDRLVLLGFLEKRDEGELQYRVREGFRRDLDLEKPWAKPPSPSLTLVVLRCADLPLSKLFYEALGLSFQVEQHASGPLHYSTSLGDTVLELYPLGAGPAAPSRFGVSVAQLDATIAALRKLGDFVVSYDANESPPRALVRDPDGNKLDVTAACV